MLPGIPPQQHILLEWLDAVGVTYRPVVQVGPSQKDSKSVSKKWSHITYTQEWGMM